MKRLVFVVAIIFGWNSAAWAAPPSTLTTLPAIDALTRDEASRNLPVAIDVTVTYLSYASGHGYMLTAQNGGAAIWAMSATDPRVAPGDRVLLHGKTHPSFRTYIDADSVTLLSHGVLPKPVPATFDKLIRGQLDCILVTVHGVIHSADLVSWAGKRQTNLQVLIDGGSVEATVNSVDESALNGLLDAEVEVSGSVAGIFDNKKQLTAIRLLVPSLADVKILRRANAGPESLPITPMDKILGNYFVRDLTPRIRVQGTITYYQPGSAVVLQSGGKSLWIRTLTDKPLRIGSLAYASGFPDVRGGFLTLTDSEIQERQEQVPIAPTPVTWAGLSSGYNAFDLVSTEGQVLMAVRGAAQDEYVLTADGHVFSAIFRHPSGIAAEQLPPMKQVPVGSRVRVTGICMLYTSTDPDSGSAIAYDLLLRSSDDIALIAKPSLLSIGNLIRVVSALLLLVIAAGAWGWAAERRVRRQTAALSARTESEAELERKRSRILEDINGSRPLAEVLENIAEMVSSMLDNAPCWCELTDGAKYGNVPHERHNLRIVRANIHVRSGPALGALFAALEPAAAQIDSEAMALNNGTRLAALAIETRRLYSDLRRRSEFDLLTDIHNRFSLDKRLNIMIEESRIEERVFGLIYIDLDKFKPINDHYGHHVGDLFLQEVALRMKRQLRGGDMLVRLGGDEFAALVSEARNRAGVEEAKLRLERCFDEPFEVNGHMLQGAASFGIALYPEDGTTNDSLLTAADAAMYEVKHSKRQIA
jgi:diguanylate cyclase (GGDEF)-like protein